MQRLSTKHLLKHLLLLSLLLLPFKAHGETCAPSCPVYPTGLDIPSEFQQMAKDIDGAIVSYNLNTVQASWTGTSPSTLPKIGAELTSVEAVSLTQAPSQTAIDNQLAAFNNLGITAIKFNIHFPLVWPRLYNWIANNNCPASVGTNGSSACIQFYYQNTSVCDSSTLCGQYVAAVQHAISKAHTYGMFVIAQSQVQPRGSIGATGSDPLDLADYYDQTYVNSDDFNTDSNSWVHDRSQMEVTLSTWTCSPTSCKPDALNVSSEPDNEGQKSGITELITSNSSFQTNYRTLLSGITSALTSAGVSHTTTKYIAGLGNWTSSSDRTKILTEQLANASIDGIDIHVHVVNDCSNPQCSSTMTQVFMANITTILNTIANNCTAGCPKKTGMDEDYPYARSNQEQGSGTPSTSEVDQRDVLQFLTVVHQHYMQAMVATAYWKSMLYVSFSSPNPLWAYDNYFTVLNTYSCTTFHSCDTPTNRWSNNSAVSASMSANTPTLTGSFLASIISGGPTFDNTKPSAPSNLVTNRISSTDVQLSWSASTDNIGVQGYKVYRDGTWVATTLVANTSYATLYEDKWAGSASTYTVHAIDAAGNESVDATTGGGGTSTASTFLKGRTKLRGRTKAGH